MSNTTAWTPPADPEKRQQLLEMLTDTIATRRDNGQPPVQGHLDRLAALKAYEKAGEVAATDESIASMEVFGHPSVTASPRYNNLVPVRIGSLNELDKFHNRAQRAFDELAGETSMKRYELSQAKAGSAKRKRLEAEINSANFSDKEAYRDLIRNETMPELSRLEKVLLERQCVAAAVETLDEDETEESGIKI